MSDPQTLEPSGAEGFLVNKQAGLGKYSPFTLVCDPQYIQQQVLLTLLHGTSCGYANRHYKLLEPLGVQALSHIWCPLREVR